MQNVNSVKHAMKKVVYELVGLPSRYAFSSFHYQRHNSRRLEHLASLGLAIHGSTVLEVGAGIGDHTSFFIDRGCTVVSTDAREKNLRILRARYPDIRVAPLEMDDPDQSFTEVFDVVHCYGLLYHLKNPDRAIEFMSGRCRGMLLLETCVSFGDEAHLNPCEENVKDPTQAASGHGCRPTRPWVYDNLKKYFAHVYMPVTQPNHEEFPVDWTDVPAAKSLTRAVFVASRERLDNVLLVEGIPSLQRRH